MSVAKIMRPVETTNNQNLVDAAMIAHLLRNFAKRTGISGK